MTADRAQTIAAMSAPGIEWTATLVTIKPPVIRLVGETPNGEVLSFYHQPWTSSGRVQLHECMAVSREVIQVAEAWAGGELR